MVGIVLWLSTETLKERRLAREAADDQEAKIKFEIFLEESNRDRFRRYEDLKRSYQAKGDDLHWQRIALEAGVAMIDIIERR